jgi:hypothetical protein
MRVMQVSERFACRVTGQHRTTQRHRRASETLADRDAALRAWLRQWAKQHPRWGVSPRLPRRTRRGLGGQPQTPPTTVARGGSAGAAAPPPQTRRRQHRGRDRGCRRAKSSVGGGLSIRRWKYQYNHHRPDSALNYEPPARYAANCPPITSAHCDSVRSEAATSG